ncbi:MAG: arylsulfatase [Planctomycetota bacterium]|nr:MAG: arylsulfatase [Planctomycetota bacterium]
MSKPNIILFFTDQQRSDTLGLLNPLMKTPNLDRLAEEGCLYENAYSPNPVCIPARHNVLTGLTDKFHGFSANAMRPMKEALPTIPQLLGDQQYHCEAIGKMHFSPMRNHHGFHRMQLMEETPKYRQDDDYLLYLKENGLGNVQHQHGVRHLLYHQPQRSLVPEKHHGSKWVADRTIDFLQKNQKDPFFLWVSWIQPHPPYNIPDEWAELYNDVDIPEPIAPIEYEKLPPKIRNASGIGDMTGDMPRIMRQKRAYYSAISYVDHQLGRILDELDQQNLTEDTLIIFTSDHGEMLGDLGLFQKASPYDGAAKIPFILKYPGKIAKGQRKLEFVDLNDVLPTILAAAGVEYNGQHELPGESLLVDNGQKDRSLQYSANGQIKYEHGANRWRMLRNEQYKYVQFYNGGFELFLDLENDPHENNNLMEGPLSSEQNENYHYLKSNLIKYEELWGIDDCVQDGELNKMEAFGNVKNPNNRNTQLPSWPPQLVVKEEIDFLTPLEDEIIKSIEKEPLVNLSKLDLEFWAEKTGKHEMAERFKNIK